VFARLAPWGAAGRSRVKATKDGRNVTALVIGLGNPGPEYATTRHNVGQMVVDELARRYGATFSRDKKCHAMTATVRVAGGSGAGTSGAGTSGAGTTVLGKPASYMNLSGGPVKALASYYRVAPADVIVVHDELDLPFGCVRIKLGGGSAGHNGLKDVTKALGGPDYVRVRVGIGRPPGRQDAADYVLRPFASSERSGLDLLVSDAADAVEYIITDGLLPAQQRVHSPR